ncbi:MAG: hypothetical protein U0401_09850 [Anaerolineae bacterium]
MKETKTQSEVNRLPAQYSFMLNPYPDMRLSRCPVCESKTGQRKVPLLIHIDPNYPVALGYTCRYCSRCDLLIGHKHEIEYLLTALFSQHNPAVIGNDYLIMGTMDKNFWREGLTQPKAIADMMPHLHVFKTYYQELRLTRPGWYPEGKEPPVMEPPPSTEWIKSKTAWHQKFFRSKPKG